MTNEIWKPVSEKLYYSLSKEEINYEVSNLGRIRNKKTGKMINPFPKYGTDKLMWTMHAPTGWDWTLQFLVDQTVYTTFTDSNDSYGRCIKHRDGNVLNNAFDNLYI